MNTKNEIIKTKYNAVIVPAQALADIPPPEAKDERRDQTAGRLE
jgi:hypothetical protein